MQVNYYVPLIQPQQNAKIQVSSGKVFTCMSRGENTDKISKYLQHMNIAHLCLVLTLRDSVAWQSTFVG